MWNYHYIYALHEGRLMTINHWSVSVLYLNVAINNIPPQLRTY